jgi:hypothetical protein
MGHPPLARNNITSRTVSLAIPAQQKFVSAVLQVWPADLAKEGEAQNKRGWLANQAGAAHGGRL